MMLHPSAIQTLNAVLTTLNPSQQALFFLITGASGVGKTTITTLLEQQLNPQYVHVAYSDRIGVPSEQEMIARYGSGKKWQEAKTEEWIKKLKTEYTPKPLIIFEGQYEPDFALAVCHKYGIHNPLILGIYAERSIREHRLIHDRKQPELANQDMQNWAELLKNKVTNVGGTVIDTTNIAPEAAIEQIAALILKRLNNSHTY